jgi:hypothetical protein
MRLGPPARAAGTRARQYRGMFARYFIESPFGAAELEDTLLHDPLAWVPDLAEHATHRGDELLAAVGVGDQVRLVRPVRIELAAPMHVAGKTVIPMRWTPTGRAGLFPALDADLEIAPLDEHRSQVAMNARYVPPLGKLGKAIDRVLLYRVAEATIKDFLDRVGSALEERTSGGAWSAR